MEKEISALFKKSIVLSFLFPVFLTMSCQKQEKNESEENIYEGRDVQNLDPGGKSTVAIGITGHPMFPGKITVLCTGSLISIRWVLTAAHCGGKHDKLFGQKAQLTSVFFGKKFEESYEIVNGKPKVAESQFRKIKSVVFHPSYSPENGINDLALVELDSAAPKETAATVKLISDFSFLKDCVGKKELNDKDCSPAWELGFGLNKDGKLGALKADMTFVLTRDEAEQIFLTARNDRPTVCGGDSGGPTLVKQGNEWKLAAIHRDTSNKCALEKEMKLYVNYSTMLTSTFRKWIEKTTKERMP